MNSEKINGLRITNKCLSNIFLLFKGHSVTAVCIYVTSCLRWGKIEEKTHEKHTKNSDKNNPNYERRTAKYRVLEIDCRNARTLEYQGFFAFLPLPIHTNKYSINIGRKSREERRNRKSRW